MTTPYEKAAQIADKLDDAALAETWESLRHNGDDGNGYNGVTFTEWCEIVYSEIDRRKRGIKEPETVEEEAERVFGACGGKCGEAPCIAWNKAHGKMRKTPRKKLTLEDAAILIDGGCPEGYVLEPTGEDDSLQGCRESDRIAEGLDAMGNFAGIEALGASIRKHGHTNQTDTIDLPPVGCQTPDEIPTIKQRAKQFVDDNFSNPTPSDYRIIETAMIIGASIAYETMAR